MYQLRADPEIIDRHLLELFLREPGTKHKIDEMKTGISDSGLNPPSDSQPSARAAGELGAGKHHHRRP